MALRPLFVAGKQAFVLPSRSLIRSTRCGLPSASLGTKRDLSVTSVNYVKKIVIEETDNQMTISAEYVESPFQSSLIKTGKEEDHVCPLCALNLDIKHTDVRILSQFLREDGCMLPRRVTGLCKTQQKRITYLVAMAQKSGLMPNIGPSWSKKDPKKRFGPKKFNRYFDESTLD